MAAAAATLLALAAVASPGALLPEASLSGAGAEEGSLSVAVVEVGDEVLLMRHLLGGYCINGMPCPDPAYVINCVVHNRC